jgi:hypothetical protein
MCYVIGSTSGFRQLQGHSHPDSHRCTGHPILEWKPNRPFSAQRYRCRTKGPAPVPEAVHPRAPTGHMTALAGRPRPGVNHGLQRKPGGIAAGAAQICPASLSRSSKPPGEAPPQRVRLADDRAAGRPVRMLDLLAALLTNVFFMRTTIRVRARQLVSAGSAWTANQGLWTNVRERSVSAEEPTVRSRPIVPIDAARTNDGFRDTAPGGRVSLGLVTACPFHRADTSPPTSLANSITKFSSCNA